MKIRSLGMPVVLLGLFVMTVVALRAADDKSKVKDSDIPSPGTVKFSTAPAAVQKTFKDETKNAKIELLGKGVNDSKIVFYNAIVPVGAVDYEMAVGEDGLLLEKVLHIVQSDDLTIQDCPPAVQKALQEDSKPVKIDNVHRVAAGRRADYFIDITVQKGRKYQLTFAEDGTLMSKLMNYDAEAKDGDAGKSVQKEDRAAEKPRKKAIK